MSNTFTAQLCDAVRSLPDEAILALVRTHLELRPGELANALRPAAEPEVPSTPPATRTRPKSERRQRLMKRVETHVRHSTKGVSLDNIYRMVKPWAPKMTKDRIKSVLRELVANGRIARAGDRKFSRYGRTKTIAQAASDVARGR